jgi:ribosome-interacting GTPase 1
MPTNVTPEYRKSEAAFREAKTIDEKIERLEDMMALLPKHKGTDHLYADLKRRMSRLKKQLESSGRRTRSGPLLDISRDGAAQLALVGPPNSGKSSILKCLTHARPEIGAYPFTTHLVQPGMMPYEDIQIQLLDSPPVTGEAMPMHLLGVIRSADAALLVADLSKDSLLDDIDAVFRSFTARHVTFVKEESSGDRFSVRCCILANKRDAPLAADRLHLLSELIGERLDIWPISCTEQESMAALSGRIFRWLGIVRVYTKAPGKKAEWDRPYTVFQGQTVGDVSLRVHKDFYDRLKFARLWRSSQKPVTVSRNEPVMDRDLLELHI